MKPENVITIETSSSSSSSSSGPDTAKGSANERVYLTPYRWWREALEGLNNGGVAEEEKEKEKGILFTAYSSSPGGLSYGAMKIISNFFVSDFAFSLKRENESSRRDKGGGAGKEYALVPGEMWIKALKWHSDSKLAAKDAGTFSAAEVDIADVYPLQLRLSVVQETNSLAVKISRKDNTVELYKRACKIFNVEYELLRIWDFSGQTTLFFMNDKNTLLKDGQRQSDPEIFLELQVYGLSDGIKIREGKKDEQILQSKMSAGGLFVNGIAGNADTKFGLTNSAKYSAAGSLGLTGLTNLGNTCFMNSAIQCLAHTPKLVDYFLGDYVSEINRENPLGMDGEIAVAFGDLLRKLWALGATPVAPRLFKSKLGHFAPQFNGFNQHDSQELLAFLLDGLHEDLNRVKCKPYVEAKDSEGRLDEEVGDEYWQSHLARNDSIIVDVCQGQYRSTLVCPVCSKVSVTFDPFMYLSLPLPSTTMRTMTVTILSTDGSFLPSSFTVTVPKYGKCKDLIQALSIACSLRSDERLLVAEIFSNRVIRYLEDPVDSLSLIRDYDRIAAYRLAKEDDDLPLVEFVHEKLGQYGNGRLTSFGIPIISRLQGVVRGSDICKLYLKLLSPFFKPRASNVDVAREEVTDMDLGLDVAREEVTDVASDVYVLREEVNDDALGLDVDREEVTDAREEDTDMKDATNDPASDDRTGNFDNHFDTAFQFWLADDKGIKIDESKIKMNDVFTVTDFPKKVSILVCWPEKMIEDYDADLLNSLPEICKSGFLARQPQEIVSLYSCLQAFLKEEPLGPEDMWYCPRCKKHCQASKKLDLWRLPEVLIIHLKRFSYSRYLKNKLETYVDFPIEDLDLSDYIAFNNNQSSYRYMLFAVSNHYGGMGGGHYTANIYHGGNQWFEFDDSRVYPISKDKIKTSAAYVLFYKRIQDA